MPTPADSSSDRLLAESAFVHRLARALVRDNDVAHDVAQEALLAAHQQPQAPRSLRDWLAGVARRLATQSQLARARRTRHELAAAKPPAGDHEAHTVERLRLHQRLTAAVLELPEPYRTAVTLRFLDELPPRAIAQRLQTTSDVVRQRVHRGLELLRARLDGEFGDREAWAGAFVAAGFGSTPALSLLLPVLLMNKLLVVAAAVIVAGAFLFWPPPETVPTSAPGGTAASAPPALTALLPASAPPSTNAAPTRVEVPAGEPPACVLLVVDDRGTPIANAKCHTYAVGSEFVVDGTTTADGRCRFRDTNGRGGLVIRAEGHAPHWMELVERSGEHRIVLPDGAEVRGTLLVDGRPGDGYELTLNGPQLQPPVPSALVAWFQGWRLALVRTGADGSFRFRGLAADWRGSLRVPMSVLLLPESGGSSENDRDAPVAAGPDALTVHATRLPGPQLRIVWQDTGAPVDNATVTAFAEFDDGCQSPLTSVAADAHGVCRLGMRDSRPSTYLRWCRPANRPGLVKAHVSVQAPGSAGRVWRTLVGEALQTDAETIVHLPRAKAVHFLAVDAAGRPVSGARVQAQDIGDPTGADGRGTFAGDAKDARAVGAPGHQVIPFKPRCASAGTLDDPLVVELPAGNSLTLRFVDAAGLPRPVSVATVRHDGWFLAGGRHAFDLDRLLYGQEPSEQWTPEQQADGSTRATDYHLSLECTDGKATLHSLEPGMLCTVLVSDSLGGATTQEVTMPAVGKHDVVDVLVPGVPLHLQCRIVDCEGKAIEGAAAFVDNEEDEGRRLQRGADGTFLFEGFGRASTVTLIARAEGFVTRRLEGIATADPQTHSIALDRGHAVTLHVVDEHDQPQPLYPYVLPPSSLFPYDDLAPGERRFRNLPPAIVTFACKIGGKRFTVDHDPRVGDAVLRVQHPGELQFACASTWPTTGERRCLVVIVRRLDADDPPIDRAQPEHPGPPLSLVPGRYRVNLCERDLRDEGGDVDRDLGRSTEVTIVAGVTATAILP